MTFQRILVGVDDSPAGLGAAQVAVELAAEWGAAVTAIIVVRDDAVTGALGGEPADTSRRLASGCRSVLGWVADLAAAKGVQCVTVVREGEPFRRILDEADAVDAELIVMGRPERRGPSPAYRGSETAHVLEFSERAVLVVPPPAEAIGSPPACHQLSSPAERSSPSATL